ncbi:MAG: hypothetical protein WCJ92_04425 [Alphaproteobacteria bacterium]
MFKLIVFVSLMFTHLSADVFPLVSAITSKAYTIPPLREPSKEVLRVREEIRRQAEMRELKARRAKKDS